VESPEFIFIDFTSSFCFDKDDDELVVVSLLLLAFVNGFKGLTVGVDGAAFVVVEGEDISEGLLALTLTTFGLLLIPLLLLVLVLVLVLMDFFLISEMELEDTDKEDEANLTLTLLEKNAPGSDVVSVRALLGPVVVGGVDDDAND
jgi:uncharacterized membrane protein